MKNRIAPSRIVVASALALNERGGERRTANATAGFLSGVSESGFAPGSASMMPCLKEWSTM